jgi:hypothetical protein
MRPFSGVEFEQLRYNSLAQGLITEHHHNYTKTNSGCDRNFAAELARDSFSGTAMFIPAHQ